MCCRPAAKAKEGGREEDREEGRGREDGEEERLDAESKQAGSWQTQAARERLSFKGGKNTVCKNKEGAEGGGRFSLWQSLSMYSDSSIL